MRKFAMLLECQLPTLLLLLLLLLLLVSPSSPPPLYCVLRWFLLGSGAFWRW